MVRGTLVGVMLFLLASACFAGQSASAPVFMPLEEARPILAEMPGAISPAIENGAEWLVWVHNKDSEIRHRLDRGEEDTLTNFLRSGVTFTSEVRIGNRELLRYGRDAGIDKTASIRADDLIHAMSSQESAEQNERVAHMRVFLERKGFSFATTADNDRIRQYMLGNLGRMRDEFLQYIHEPTGANSFEMYKDRGISLDTNLYPDFLIERHLTHMLAAGLLKPGSVHRVAIIGPGLDFSNKEAGNDFYPPQTVQPFAVLDSLVRLGLSHGETVQMDAIDISPEVNLHIARARKLADKGEPYVVQLPWSSLAPFNLEYRANFMNYWEHLGSAIGITVKPIPVPPGTVAGAETRAIAIRPEIVARITPIDADIVCQGLPGKNYDLIVETNVFVYYNDLELSLAGANLAKMLSSTGFLIANDKLPDTVRSDLRSSLLTEQVVVKDPEYMFSYHSGSQPHALQ